MKDKIRRQIAKGGDDCQSLETKLGSYADERRVQKYISPNQAAYVRKIVKRIAEKP